MIDNIIYQILAAASGVTSLVGTSIFTVLASQSNLSAYVVIHIIDIVPENTKDGVSKLDQVRVQIDSFHGTKSSCDSLAVAIRTALDNYSGSVGTTLIDNIYFDQALNDYDYDRDLYKVQQDFIVRHKRS